MPVNVAFGPSAGIGGALSFGTGARKYSDRKAQVEQQSKRQMLSDAMGFAKFLQESRRPAEQHQRNLERMEKSKEIAQSNATHAANIRYNSNVWDQQYAEKVKTQQLEGLYAGREKIEQEAQRKVAADMPQNDVNKWKAGAIAKNDSMFSGVTGQKPPPGMNPWDNFIAEDGQTYYLGNNNKLENLTAQRRDGERENRKLQIEETKVSNAVLSENRKALKESFAFEQDLLQKEIDAFNSRWQSLLEPDEKGETGMTPATQKIYDEEKQRLDEKKQALLGKIQTATEQLETEHYSVEGADSGYGGVIARRRLEAAAQRRRVAIQQAQQQAENKTLVATAQSAAPTDTQFFEQFEAAEAPNLLGSRMSAALSPQHLGPSAVRSTRVPGERDTAYTLASGKSVSHVIMRDVAEMPSLRRAFLAPVEEGGMGGTPEDIKDFTERHTETPVARTKDGKRVANHMVARLIDEYDESKKKNTATADAMGVVLKKEDPDSAMLHGDARRIKELVEEIDGYWAKRVAQAKKTGVDPHSTEKGYNTNQQKLADAELELAETVAKLRRAKQEGSPLVTKGHEQRMEEWRKGYKGPISDEEYSKLSWLERAGISVFDPGRVPDQDWDETGSGTAY